MTTHIARYYREIYVQTKLRARMVRRMKESALSYLSGHSAAYLAEQKAGQLAAKVASGAAQLTNFSQYLSRLTSNAWLLLISFYYIGRAQFVVFGFGCRNRNNQRLFVVSSRKGRFVSGKRG